MSNSIILVSVPGGWPEDAPPRSAFFGLTPAGCSGESFEDLASYFRRLSAQHGILPWSLARRAIAPFFADQTAYTEDTVTNSCYDLSMNGVAGMAAGWVDALESLTFRNDLALRTLLPLRKLVAPFALVSKRERFCPRCYRDDECANRPKYNRLLWSIASVEACPLHETLLQPAPYARQVEMRSFWLPGISRLDGSSLSESSAGRANGEQITSARLVAELLDDVHQHPQVFADRSSPSTFLQYAVSTLFNGKAAQFANHLGINRSELHGWTTGKIRPSLPRLVLIAYCCGCGVSDVLLGNRVMLTKVRRTVDARCLAKRQRNGSAKSKEELLAELEKIVDSGVASNLRSAARLLDISEKFLHRLAPDIAARLVATGKEVKHAEILQREDLRFEHFWQSFQDLCLRNVYPARRKVRERMYLQTGMKLGFDEASRFLRRAHHRAETAFAIKHPA